MHKSSIETNPVLAEAARGRAGTGRPMPVDIHWPLLFVAVLANVMFAFAGSDRGRTTQAPPRPPAAQARRMDGLSPGGGNLSGKIQELLDDLPRAPLAPSSCAPASEPVRRRFVLGGATAHFSTEPQHAAELFEAIRR